MIVLGMDSGMLLGAAARLVGVVLVVFVALLPRLEVLAGREGRRGDR